MFSVLDTNPQRRSQFLIFMGLIGVILAALGISVLGLDVIDMLLAVFVVVLILFRPFFGLLLLVATIPIEALLLVGGEFTATRLLGIAVLGLWGVQKLLKREPLKALIANRFVVITLALFSLALISALWADFPGDVYAPLLRLVRMFLLSLLVIDLVNTWNRAVWFVRVLVISGIVAATLTIIQFLTGQVSTTGRAGASIAGGINNTAAVLVVLIPFSLYIIRSHTNRAWRMVGFTYLILAIFAVTVTISRTAFLLILLAAIIEFWETMRKRAGVLWIVFAVIIALFLIINLTPTEAITARLQTISPTLANIISPSDLEEATPGTISARGFIYRVGLNIFLEHPIIGVGLENFRRHYLVYQFEVPDMDKLVTYLRSPHSVYLAFLVDLGIIGLSIFLALIYYIYRTLAKTHNNIESSNDPDKSKKLMLFKAITISTILLLLYGFASTVQYEKLLWVIFGLCIAIYHLSTLPTQSESESTSMD